MTFCSVSQRVMNRFTLNFCEWVGCGRKTKWLDFGGDLDHHDPHPEYDADLDRDPQVKNQLDFGGSLDHIPDHDPQSKL